MSKNIDKVIFIGESFDLFENVECIPAIYTSKTDYKGYLQSHIQAIKLAKERNYKNVLILEDNFQLVVSKEEVEKQLTDFFDAGIEYSVCMISYDMQSSKPTEYPFLTKIIESNGSSGYILHQNYYDELINLFEWSITKLYETGDHWNFAVDNCWKFLQPNGKWYCFTEPLGKVKGT